MWWIHSLAEHSFLRKHFWNEPIRVFFSGAFLNMYLGNDAIYSSAALVKKVFASRGANAVSSWRRRTGDHSAAQKRPGQHMLQQRSSVPALSRGLIQLSDGASCVFEASSPPSLVNKILTSKAMWLSSDVSHQKGLLLLNQQIHSAFIMLFEKLPDARPSKAKPSS